MYYFQIWRWKSNGFTHTYIYKIIASGNLTDIIIITCSNENAKFIISMQLQYNFKNNACRIPDDYRWSDIAALWREDNDVKSMRWRGFQSPSNVHKRIVDIEIVTHVYIESRIHFDVRHFTRDTRDNLRARNLLRNNKRIAKRYAAFRTTSPRRVPLFRHIAILEIRNSANIVTK